MTRRAFTLIELLVVIAIIAILAAILFPVFAQAKLAAKKTAGLSQAKQVGLALNMYAGDVDDVLPFYRATENGANTPINPTYLKLKAAGDPLAAKFESEGARSIPAIFFNQLIEPYTKSADLFKAPGYSNGWANVQDKGTWDPGFYSYGGQNSYAVNNYLFTSTSTTSPRSPLSMTAIAEVSNTLAMVDATYYNALPAQPDAGACRLNGFNPSGSYLHYWKHLGNSVLNFNALGSPNPNDPSNAKHVKDAEARYGGTLNVVRTDSSAKSIAAKQVISDLRDKGVNSFWNPLKSNCE